MDVKIAVASALIGKPQQWIRMGLRSGRLTYGDANYEGRWSFRISESKFEQQEGIIVPEDQNKFLEEYRSLPTKEAK